jgi:hypothetical protein
MKKTGKAVIRHLEKPEIDALLAAPDQRTAQGRRDHALLRFLYNTGARASEAAQVKVADLDLSAASVKITRKGGKQRFCLLWAATVSELAALIGERVSSGPVFLKRRSCPIIRFGIHGVVERNVLQALPRCPSMAAKRVIPHSIRHTSATHLPRAGVDINTIRGLARSCVAGDHEHLRRGRFRDQGQSAGEMRCAGYRMGPRALAGSARADGLPSHTVADLLCGIGKPLHRRRTLLSRPNATYLPRPHYASGFPTGFVGGSQHCARSAAQAWSQHARFAEDRFHAERSDASSRHLVAAGEEVAHAVIEMSLDHPIRGIV